ncbi:hypothetical protein D3C77_674300 [compost metagenome]
MGQHVRGRAEAGDVGTTRYNRIDHALVGRCDYQFHRHPGRLAQALQQRLVLAGHVLGTFDRDHRQAQAAWRAVGQRGIDQYVSHHQPDQGFQYTHALSSMPLKGG